MRENKLVCGLLGLLGLMAAGSTLAQTCPASCGASGTTMNQSQIASLLGGKTVCAVLGTEVWQELHEGTTTDGGVLSDLKGTATAQEVVGRWFTTTRDSASVVRYNYGTGGIFDYIVCAQTPNATTVHFCGSALGGRNITNARVITSGAC